MLLVETVTGGNLDITRIFCIVEFSGWFADHACSPVFNIIIIISSSSSSSSSSTADIILWREMFSFLTDETELKVKDWELILYSQFHFRLLSQNSSKEMMHYEWATIRNSTRIQ
jgi:hypothetical protein